MYVLWMKADKYVVFPPVYYFAAHTLSYQNIVDGVLCCVVLYCIVMDWTGWNSMLSHVQYVECLLMM